MTMTRTHTYTFTSTSFVKPLVKAILEHPEGHEWSLQGFGMLRTYLGADRNLRLHVWDSRFKVEGVDELHTHPWNFHSYVVAGKVINTRYEKKMIGKGFAVEGDPYHEQEILCGEGGHKTDTSRPVALRADRPETITECGTYSQLAHEIHRSQPADGTVTIIEREFLDDADHAFVYIPMGAEWVSAEPRAASDEEVKAICSNALETWF